jgi:hypothetical protein
MLKSFVDDQNADYQQIMHDGEVVAAKRRLQGIVL